jgi:putative transposase
VTTPTMDVLDVIRKRADDRDIDFLRETLQVVLHAVMDADISAQIGAGLHEHTPDRLAYRNGYRQRRWDTRAGTVDLRIPKLREGSYLPAFLEPRRRSERALLAVVQQAYVEGVSTRRVEDLVRALGCDGISRSEVSRICQALDEQVQAFRERPLDQGPYPYVWLDALTQRVREGGRVVNVAVVVATAVNAQGKREVLGLDTGASEDGAFWLSFLRSLAARGLAGVQLVVSDAHQGLKDAIAAVFSGAAWQRCRTHFTRNLLTRVPKSAQPMVATVVRSIFEQPSADEVRAQYARVVEQLTARFPDAARMLSDARDEVLAFTHFPKPHWRKVRSNNPQERLNLEIRRRTDVVGIFPNRAAVVRLVGAVLAEQHDEWQVGRRYLADESLRLIPAHAPPSTTHPLGTGQEEPPGQLPFAV